MSTKMYIQSTRRLPHAPRPDGGGVDSPSGQETKKQASEPIKPGLLFGIENPSLELAEAARATLGLATRPESVLVAVPPRAVELTPLEKALVDTGVSAVRMLTKEWAKASGSKLVQGGVNAIWLGVKAWKLYDGAQSPDRKVAALFVDTASTTLSALGLAHDMTGTPSAFFDDDVLQENLDLIFTATKAAAEGEPVEMALTNKRFGATDVGKALGLVSPILQAAASSDPAFAGVKFKPLPYVLSSPLK